MTGPIQLFPQQQKILLTHNTVENKDCCLIYQEGVAHNPSIYVEKIVFVITAECNDGSFRCCSDPGKYHYSPERLKRESYQADDFHLGGRNGRRRSG